jgi:hypothetical protein
MPGARVEARGLLRTQARTLLTSLDARLVQRGALDADTRAHLVDCADTLRQASKAPLQRLSL